MYHFNKKMQKFGNSTRATPSTMKQNFFKLISIRMKLHTTSLWPVFANAVKFLIGDLEDDRDNKGVMKSRVAKTKKNLNRENWLVFCYIFVIY